MSQYQLSSVAHIPVPLTDLAYAFRQDMTEYQHDKILPIHVCNHRSDLIRSFNKSSLLRVPDLWVGPSGKPKQTSFRMDSNKTYACKDVSLETVVDFREQADMDPILNYPTEKLYWLMVGFQQGMEYYVIKQIMRNTALITNYTDLSSDPSQQWDQLDSDNSNPVTAIRQQVLKMELTLGGKTPNYLGMSKMTWQQIQHNKEVRALAGLTSYGAPFINEAQFEQLCYLPPGSLHLHSLTYNAALQDQTAAYRSFMGPDVVLAYTAPVGQRVYGLGYQHWFPGNIGDGDGQVPEELRGSPFAVYNFPDVSGQVTLGGGYTTRVLGGLDAVIHNADAAYLWQNAVDPNNTAKYGDFLKGEP